MDAEIVIWMIIFLGGYLAALVVMLKKALDAEKGK